MAEFLNAEDPAFLLLGRIDEWCEGTSAFDKSLYSFAIQNIAEEYMSTSIPQVSFEFEEKTKIAWLIQPKQEGFFSSRVTVTRERALAFVKGAAEMIQNACKKLLNIKLSFPVGTTYREWKELSDQFEHLRLLMNRGLGLGQELLLLEQESHELAADLDVRELRKQMKKMTLMQTLLENGQ
ncbi:hypothetical protein [Paenibacillus sp. NRS-1760]|uniref:hypothetical protein n=1 Tax=Paenibacillus sp. NRS-1760 TaxID=3233902 RepID=UPI003D2A23A5